MFKNQFYKDNKKINLYSSTYHSVVVCTAIYLFLISILFLIQYYDSDRWFTLVKSNSNIFGKNTTTNFNELQNVTKLIYLMRFWGSVLIFIGALITASIYRKKAKHGYLYPSLFIALTIVLIVSESVVSRGDLILFIWKPIFLIPILISYSIILKNTFDNRRNLNMRYAEKVRKGEI